MPARPTDKDWAEAVAITFGTRGYKAKWKDAGWPTQRYEVKVSGYTKPLSYGQRFNDLRRSTGKRTMGPLEEAACREAGIGTEWRKDAHREGWVIKADSAPLASELNRTLAQVHYAAAITKAVKNGNIVPGYLPPTTLKVPIEGCGDVELGRHLHSICATGSAVTSSHRITRVSDLEKDPLEKLAKYRLVPQESGGLQIWADQPRASEQDEKIAKAHLRPWDDEIQSGYGQGQGAYENPPEMVQPSSYAAQTVPSAANPFQQDVGQYDMTGPAFTGHTNQPWAPQPTPDPQPTRAHLPPHPQHSALYPTPYTHYERSSAHTGYYAAQGPAIGAGHHNPSHQASYTPYQQQPTQTAYYAAQNPTAGAGHHNPSHQASYTPYQQQPTQTAYYAAQNPTAGAGHHNPSHQASYTPYQQQPTSRPLSR